MQTPTYAAGNVYLSSIMDSLVCQSYYNSAYLTVMGSLIGGMVSHDVAVKQSNLYHIRVPPAFHGQPFERLFDYLTLKQNIVPLGLYRLPGCTDNKSPYVVTNPSPQTKITDKDYIFILAEKKPGDEIDTWNLPNERKLAQRTWTEFGKMGHLDPATERYLKRKTALEKLNDESFVRKKVMDILTLRIDSLKQKIQDATNALHFRERNIFETIRKAIKEELSKPVKLMHDEEAYSSFESSHSSETLSDG
jgi:hypothetical protein